MFASGLHARSAQTILGVLLVAYAKGPGAALLLRVLRSKSCTCARSEKRLDTDVRTFWVPFH